MSSATEATGFGEYCKLLRLERKLTLTKAAKKMGFTPQKLNDIEAGRRYTKRVSLALITKLAKAYDVPVAKIIRETQTVITSERSVSELINEIWPQARLSELVAKSLLDDLRTYPAEIEAKGVELYTAVQNVRVLITAMRKKHFNTEGESATDIPEETADEA